MSVLNEIEINTLNIDEKESDDLFLDLIKERPCLYNKQLPEYHDKVFLENAMEDIAFIMHDTVENCEQRWKRFQSMYQREKMLEEKENRSGSAASQRKKWPFYQKMKALYSCNSYRTSLTNVQNSKDDKRTVQSVPLVYGKRKKQKSDELVTSAFNSVQNQLSTLMHFIDKNNESNTVPKSCEQNDCISLVSKVVAARLDELSPTSAKRKRKQILKYLADYDSDDST